MRLLRFPIYCALLSSVILSGTQAEVSAKPPVEAFGQLPALKSPILTPDGKHFAVIQSLNGRPAILIYQTGAPAGTQPVAIPTGDWIAEHIEWANNSRLIMVIKKSYQPTGDTKVETWHRAIAIGLDGSNPIVLLAEQKGFRYNTSTADVVGRSRSNPDIVYMELYQPHATVMPGASHLTKDEDYNVFRLDLLSVDVNSGRTETVAKGERETEQWVVDGNGEVVARVDKTKHPLQDHLFLNHGGKFEEVAQFDATADKGLAVEGLTESGKALVVRSIAGPTATLDSIDLSTGARSQLYAVPGYDVGSVIHNRWTGHVIGAAYTDDKLQVHFFQPDLEALQLGLEKNFPGDNVTPITFNETQDKLVFLVDGPQKPPTYYYLDRITHKAEELAGAYPSLKPSDLGEQKPYPYAARDGLQIHAYLTLPPGKAAKNLPVVIMPHGGPDARDAIGFDWWAQFLANRGYAVLQPNFRGSAGYGRAFTKAGLHQWGLKMQDDISDGVKKLIADGIADPRRVCIVGASYGGYATLAGATFSPELYACAASWAGVSDLPAILATEFQLGGRDAPIYSFWASRIGDDSEDETRLIATSPARHADRVRAPILLMHGEGDTTVRINQSEIEEKALRAAGKNVEFIRLGDGEDHYMNVAETRIKMLREVEKFLDKNIGH